MEIAQPNFFERLNNWIKESITVKMASIGFLVIILLIPQAWIESIIIERQGRAEAVVQEIASKWSGVQTVAGPVLVIPYFRHEKIDKGKDGVEIRHWTEKAFFLPEQLKIKGKVDAQILHRGIFDAAVYESALSMSADFLSPDFEKLNIAAEDVQWKEAYLILGVNDLRGISANPKLKMGDQDLTGEPSNNIGLSYDYSAARAIEGDRGDTPSYQPPPLSSSNGIVMRLPWKSLQDFRPSATVDLNLKGSTFLCFSPVGKTTDVSLEGPWANPSFDGAFLPDPATKEITAAGFKANWKVLHFNRPFSQQWTGSDQKISGAEFGVKLLIPVDQYQKSIRTAKYGILIILLTFISLFMVEIGKKIRIHPFQYILVGAALIIYYSLLLAFSEHLGYNVAYGIATAATVVLISLYSSTFLESRKMVLLFTGLLSFFYGFIFVIIQMQDYSLLLGSIGLFMIIGLIMYFSKGIKWYGERP